MFIPRGYEKTIADLENRVYKDVETLDILGQSIPIYEVKSINAYIQFLGYIKFKNAMLNLDVFFRGQTDTYHGDMIPALYRRKSKAANDDSNNIDPSRRLKKMKEHYQEAKGKATDFKDMDDNLFVPLLQHYGIKTDWIDLVDNAWVALWFALHKQNSEIIDVNQFVSYKPVQKNESGYVVCICSDAISKGNGVYSGKVTSVVDLRKAVQSVYLRPHAQHGIMLQKKHNRQNYNDRIICMIKIAAQDGLAWLGAGSMLSQNYLFPSAFTDHGLKMMLTELKPYCDKLDTETHGTIQIFI